MGEWDEYFKIKIVKIRSVEGARVSARCELILYKKIHETHEVFLNRNFSLLLLPLFRMHDWQSMIRELIECC